MSEIEVRPRETIDVPALVEVLAAQQATSSYPLRWPLPFPAEEFIVRSDELMAWVAELGGRVVGHVSVCRLDGEVEPVFTETLGTDRLALIAVLFVGMDTRGTGAGGRLHDVAVGWIRESGRLPVLDVVPTHGRAVEFYHRRGWRDIGQIRPGWLPADRPALRLMVLDS